MTDAHRLDPDCLRWTIDETALPFESTESVDPAEGVMGQPIAIEAMRFGVEIDAPGQNIYVRGVTGTGRMTLVRSVLDQLNPSARRRLDRCYVHHFARPDQPRLVTLPCGEGPAFRRAMKEVATFIGEGLGEALNSPALRARRDALKEETQAALKAITDPLEKELEEHGMKLVQLKAGPSTQTAIFPLHEGEPVPPDQYKKLAAEGQVSDEDLKRFEEEIEGYAKRLGEVSEQAGQAYRDGLKKLQEYMETETRKLLQGVTRDITMRWQTPAVNHFINEVIDDVIENRLGADENDKLPDPDMIYGVNVLHTHAPENGEDAGPVVVENTPTVANLLGSIEPEFLGNGKPVSNYRGVRAGALVRADGGYLVLDARDVLVEPGAWRVLMRALRTGRVEISPSDLGWPYRQASLKPEPIDIQVRVILLGDGGLYYQLDAVDQDFSNLFKVLADFSSEIDRCDEGIQNYAGVIARLVRDEGLPHFTAGGVAAMVEHGARIAAREGKVTARFGRVADIAREAAFVAREQGQDYVEREDVETTVARTKYRASLPSQRFQEMLSSGRIRVDTTGEVVGQVNGLAVINAGPLTYGFPSRITATIGAGRAGIIDIEAAASMSGSIHTKGFQILGGCLRFLLQAEHPLAFSASMAFEQSYGGIDGDSASGAEICCLISALTDVPIRQSFAMTGAIDQHGNIQPIGGVNEKIEGFFDACRERGLTGDQGVVIPTANAGDLMLRGDVVTACREGRFGIHAVASVMEALEVLTGLRAGPRDASGRYPEAEILEIARDKAREYWQRSMASPNKTSDAK